VRRGGVEGGDGGMALRWCLKAVEVKGWGLLGDILVELGHYQDDERKRGGTYSHRGRRTNSRSSIFGCGIVRCGVSHTRLS